MKERRTLVYDALSHACTKHNVELDDVVKRLDYMLKAGGNGISRAETWARDAKKAKTTILVEALKYTQEVKKVQVPEWVKDFPADTLPSGGESEHESNELGAAQGDGVVGGAADDGAPPVECPPLVQAVLDPGMDPIVPMIWPMDH